MTAVAAPAQSVSERLADHVVGLRFEDLPAAVVEHAKDLIVYDLSLAFAGRFTELGRQGVALAQRLSAGGGSATVVGHRVRLTLLDAIYAHSQFLDGSRVDSHHAAKLLMGLVTHPVAWVLGEQERASGRDLITALVVGYDVAAKLAEPVKMAGDYARMPHKCAFGPFAAAAIAARLLRQDRSHAAQTLARAAHLGMGNNEGYGESRVFALMARDAVTCALLPPLRHRDTLRALESPYGLYATLFGGVPEGLEASLTTLGREFEILRAITKEYPGSASHVAVLEAARHLLQASGVAARDITSAVAVVPEEFRGRFGKREAVLEWPAPAEDDLIMSLRLRLAILFVTGAIVRPTFAQLRSREVQAMLPKIAIAFESRPDDYGRVEISWADGRTLHREAGIASPPKGDWSTWLHRDGERFLSDARLARLDALLSHLEDVRDVAEVLACTVPDRDEE